ncbi:hypothetical protein E1A91_D01G266100v1 [Gossypium mustelinum]|uniref:Leucine-rich repeat-containing N-terminal plant-type domain-containing protein n=1 Tax=Gossypium mustelinum TaxID=34275 RepID=A0A5D2WE38_GOSMU|nr:hypothetical protein E1A91_D01G266100v1 [Gossypium mustelinum]
MEGKFNVISSLVLVSGQCQSDQRQLLLELNLSGSFRSTTFATPLGRLMKWNQTKDCCSWEGVSCDAGGHVIGLDLSIRGISSPIDDSSSLFRFQHLQRLNLAFNWFKTSFPTGFDKLENLSYLNLSYSGFKGQIPVEISRLTRLVTLDFSAFPISKTSLKLEKPNLDMLVQNLTRLRFLYLDGITISATGNELCRDLLPFTKLQVLSMSDCYLSGPIPSFSSFKNLRELNLGDNQLSGTIHSTDWSGLSKLEIVDLSNNKLSGTIPPTLFGIQSLRRLFLSQNQFNGSIGDLHGKASSLLGTLDLSSNKLQGQFPMFVFELHGLTLLDLSSNNFSGLIPMSAFPNLRNLSDLDLSYNRLSIDAPATNISPPSFPTFTALELASCNLTEFPGFLKNQYSLNYLDLSNNQIHGEIPNWIWKSINLWYLNISQNFLVGFERPMKNINSGIWILDLHGNQLQGQVPILPSYATYLDYSDNISALFYQLILSLCNHTNLQVLDLSNNSMSGPIPQCLFQMSRSLGVLNLRRNNLSGIISDTLSKSCRLQTLNLNQNLLEGKVPKSLGNCKMLEVLDIGNNQINDSFPCQLKNITMLRVLVLRSNNFNGHIDCPGTPNNFRGKLHLTCLGTWKAMQPNPDKNQSELKHLQFEDFGGGVKYQDAITITIKGLELELVKILTMFTSIDISYNNFEGPIPGVIGKFKELLGLNFSRNAFTGSIPSFFGKLQQLDSLDLSSNSLRGEIPFRLANLNFLSFLNVSINKLVGPIPTSTQLQTFSEASFENNTGLCGPPLKTACGLPSAKEDSPSDSETGSIIDWNH